MKRYLLVFRAIVIIFSLFIVSSCGSLKEDFSVRKYTNFDNRQHVKVDFNRNENKNRNVELYAGTDVKYTSEKDVLVNGDVIEDIELKGTTTSSNSRKDLIKGFRKELNRIQKKRAVVTQQLFVQGQKSNLEEKVFNRKTEPSDDSRFWMEILFAIIIPPLGVYLHEKETNRKFWISLIITLIGLGLVFSVHGLFFLMAIVYSVLVVTDSL